MKNDQYTNFDQELGKATNSDDCIANDQYLNMSTEKTNKLKDFMKVMALLIMQYIFFQLFTSLIFTSK